VYLSVRANNPSPSTTRHDTRRDRIIPWYFVMAFMVVFAVNGVFVYTAIHTNHGVVTENAYEKGLKFDHIVAEVRKRNATSE
jgi:nitrogen fixation protein FixH